MGDAMDGDGFQTGNNDDDMRTELQNLQLQMDQTTDEVNIKNECISHSFEKCLSV